MKKFLYIPLFLFLLPAFGVAQKEGSTLVLWHPDGTTTDIALFTRPQVTFVGDKLYVTSTLATLEYDATDVVRFTYRDVPATGIIMPEAEADYEQLGDALVFRGLKHTDRPVVFTPGGVRVPLQFKAQPEGLSLPLSALPTGVYILSINGRTSKFTKK